MNQLNSPIDITLLRRFAQKNEWQRGDAIWEMMRMIGEDLVMFLKTLRERVDFVAENAEFIEIGEGKDSLSVLFMPRCEPMPDDPSSGLIRYIDQPAGRLTG